MTITFYKSFVRYFFPAILLSASCALALTACSQPSASIPAPAAEVALAPSSAPQDVQVFFDSGSNVLSAEANQKLDQVARLYREGNPLVMFVTGHADNTGGEYPNLLLSGERARTTKEALVARGIPANRLQIQAMGNSLPRDPNATAPQDNRRVVITWR